MGETRTRRVKVAPTLGVRTNAVGVVLPGSTSAVAKGSAPRAASFACTCVPPLEATTTARKSIAPNLDGGEQRPGHGSQRPRHTERRGKQRQASLGCPACTQLSFTIGSRATTAPSASSRRLPPTCSPSRTSIPSTRRTNSYRDILTSSSCASRASHGSGASVSRDTTRVDGVICCRTCRCTSGRCHSTSTTSSSSPPMPAHFKPDRAKTRCTSVTATRQCDTRGCRLPRSGASLERRVAS